MRRDERFEVRCAEEELARWKAAVPRGVAFGAWVRGALDAAAHRAKVEAFSTLDVVAEVRLPERVAPKPDRVVVSPSFRPDFKGGKK